MTTPYTDEAAPSTRPGKRGPGRPAKPKAPRGEHQARLADALEASEAERDAAAAAYADDTTVGAEIRLLRAEVGVSSGWASYCRAQGNATHAIKYAELQAKFSARLAALRELEGIDKLTALEARSHREDALGKSGGAR